MGTSTTTAKRGRKRLSADDDDDDDYRLCIVDIIDNLTYLKVPKLSQP
jgi:hypothetical protein